MSTETTMEADIKAAMQRSIVIDACSMSVSTWHERLDRSGVTALQIAAPWPWDNAGQALSRIREYHRLTDAEQRFGIVETVDDIRKYKSEGRVGLILRSRGSLLLDQDVDLVDVFHGAGLRVMQLSYNERNLAADGCLESSNSGLSNFGRSLVRQLNETGVQIDLATTGERSSLETMELSESPCMFGYANPRATALDQFQNLTDDQIRACAEGGGVIGLTPWLTACAAVEGQRPAIEDYIRHIEYVVDLVGIDHVAIGTDSEATPGSFSPELALIQTKLLRRNRSDLVESLKRPSLIGMTPFDFAKALQSSDWGATGIESIGELPNLVAALSDRGWTLSDITSLLGENILRVYEASWEARA